MKNRLVIYTDGGARGNPGPAAIGVVIQEISDKRRGINKYYGEAIGNTTNNIAEYKALIFGLKKAKSLLGGKKAEETEVEVRSDSELIVSQLKGEYKIKEEGLKPLFIDVWNLKQDFKSVSFVHIPREKNREADKLVNQALDTLL
ncbi:MAG: ribonuclease HI family protein [Minisyncoccia bacterium]|jgi:ribonuclease HI